MTEKSESWLLVTGSRQLSDKTILHRTLGDRLAWVEEHKSTLVLVHGACPTGADYETDLWGRAMQEQGRAVRIEAHPAKGHPTEDFGEWPGAGPNRNTFIVNRVARHAGACLAIVDQCTSSRCRRTDRHPSHGTMDCLRKAKSAGIPVTEVDLWKES